MRVIVGLGKTGISCVRFCLRSNIPFAVVDSRANPPFAEELRKIAPNAEYVFGSLDSNLILKADQLIVSPGVSLKEKVIEKAIASGIPCVGDVELFLQKVTAPIVAITGANAKSTVTALVGEMAKAFGCEVVVAGNIGVPVLDTLAAITKPIELYVLEISSFQLDTTSSLKAKAATILNISEDHMDRYDSMAEYVASKQKIYAGCSTAVTNRADNLTKPKMHVASEISFGLDKPKTAKDYGVLEDKGEKYLARGTHKIMPISQLQLIGMHNSENALAALALAASVGIDEQACIKVLQSFCGLLHRCQLVRTIRGVKWYNDSKGTNVGATIAAIKGLASDQGSIVLIAGGLGKGADFTPLRDIVSKHVRHVILIGVAAKDLFKALEGACTITKASLFEEAINIAAAIAKSGDQVLLSPACASYDMFRNYEHRGEEFVRLVNELV